MFPLPARLAHPGDHPLERQLAEHDAAHAELAVHATSTPGDLAPVALAAGVLRFLLHLCKHTLARHTRIRITENTEMGTIKQQGRIVQIRVTAELINVANAPQIHGVMDQSDAFSK